MNISKCKMTAVIDRLDLAKSNHFFIPVTVQPSGDTALKAFVIYGSLKAGLQHRTNGAGCIVLYAIFSALIVLIYNSHGPMLIYIQMAFIMFIQVIYTEVRMFEMHETRLLWHCSNSRPPLKKNCSTLSFMSRTFAGVREAMAVTSITPEFPSTGTDSPNENYW